MRDVHTLAVSIISRAANGSQCCFCSYLREASASFCVFPLRKGGAWSRAPGRAVVVVQALLGRNESESLTGLAQAVDSAVSLWCPAWAVFIL